ncbi:unnamed protein product, partial [Heterobilharzia americana]
MISNRGLPVLTYVLRVLIFQSLFAESSMVRLAFLITRLKAKGNYHIRRLRFTILGAFSQGKSCHDTWA